MLKQELYSAAAFAFLVGLGCLSNYLTHNINVQVLSEESEKFQPDAFIATRSYDDLVVLNEIGPKATGSIANEVHTLEFLLKRANQIKHEYSSISEITIDVQLASGQHLASAHYRDVQNLVVRLEGTSDKAIMVNCHFDSEPGSYGAGDDAVNCCIMLEILRVMAKSGKKNDHSVIFLFNGNEEGNLEGLQASHGFINTHKWAGDIKAFVNLEAQGVSGREMLFRSGPKHSWLVTKYRQTAAHPFGQVFAEEMFETGVLRSGTDFTSFKDASVPGLDFAYCSGGWKYHTKFDHIRYVTLESIQNTGNNILPLVKLMANSDEVLDPPEGTPAVYYDLWGLVFISYSKAVGAIINIVVSVLAVAIPFLVQIEFKRERLATVSRETLISFVTFFLSMILSLAACYGLGLIMNSVDNTMFWFNATILSLGVYGALAVIVQIAVHHASAAITAKFTKKSAKSELFEGKFEQRRKVHAQLNGINLFWAVLTIVITSIGFRLGYVIMVALAISLITNLLMYLLHKILPATRLHSWIFLHFIGHSFSFLWTAYLVFILWRVFIPITEKTYYANPEAMISLYCGMMTVVTLSYFIPLTSLLKTRAIIYTTLIAAFVISLILSFTSAGFPYSGSLAEPRVQRHYVTHTRRTFYDADGAVKFTDLGYFFKENERNTKRTMDTIFDPDLLLAKDDDLMCATDAFCGFPSYNATNGFWMVANEHPKVKLTNLKLASRVENGNSIEMSFEVVGTILTLIFVAPEPGVTIISDSKGFAQREWTEGKVADYLKLTFGKPSKEPFTFSVSIDKSAAQTADLLKVTIVTFDMHFDDNPRAVEFQSIISKFPDYTFVQSHQADVSSYTFQ